MDSPRVSLVVTFLVAGGCQAPIQAIGGGSGSGGDDGGAGSATTGMVDPTTPGGDSTAASAGASTGGAVSTDTGAATTDPATTDATTTAVATGGASTSTTGGGGETTSAGSSSTGEPSNACMSTETFEMLPSEATLSGDWYVSMSGLGEGEIAFVDPGDPGNGSILYEPDIPCDDTWYIWVRALDLGDSDSYFATLDGEPVPPAEAIFEGGCTGGGFGYEWVQLNWRDPMDPGCTYLFDPWAPDWIAGVHQIEFRYREINAMGRILLTNDPAYVP